jgi:hypothetical protein
LAGETEKTMLDVWLQKESDSFEILERASREAPTLVESRR